MYMYIPGLVLSPGLVDIIPLQEFLQAMESCNRLLKSEMPFPLEDAATWGSEELPYANIDA